MKRDARCDLCREDVGSTPEATVEYLDGRGLRGAPPARTREIAAHVERYAGRYELVFRGEVAGGEPLDVLVVPQSADRPYKLLVTSGLSDHPMRPPPRAGMDLCRAELAFTLPPDWRLTRRALRESRWRWPLTTLFDLADYVIRREAWIWCRHTLGNGGERLDPSVAFEALLLHHSSILGDGFSDLELESGEGIHFLSVWPVHEDELTLCMERGADTLVERLVAAGFTDRLVPDRSSVIDGGVGAAP